MKTSPVAVVAMSGGVDSTVAAAMYVKKGYRVIGLTLQMTDFSAEDISAKSCCSASDSEKFSKIASILGIEHHFLSLGNDFEKYVLKPSEEAYSSGKTPNPCILCNKHIKFGKAVQNFMREHGASVYVTGHYAVIDKSLEGCPRLLRGSNLQKDQTYFLSALSREQLLFTEMPLGNIEKSEVRAAADCLGLPNAKQKDSQDACFTYSGETFPLTLARYFEKPLKPGFITAKDGKVLGRHPGIQKYTLGQRKGLGVALGKPGYVLEIDAENDKVVITDNPEDLNCSEFYAAEMNWLNFAESGEKACFVQTRYRQKPQRAIVSRLSDGRAKVMLEKPLAAVTPGQRLAVYSENELLAAGEIILL